MNSNTAISVLHNEINWLQSVIDQVMRSYTLQDTEEKDWREIPLPELPETGSPYADTVKRWQVDIYSRLALALAMAPHIRPEVLDIFLGKSQVHDKGYTEFGGVTDKSHSGFLPTGQTLNFLISASKPELINETMSILGKDSILIQEQVLMLAPADKYAPRLSGLLAISLEWLDYFLTGRKGGPEYSAAFPAQILTTDMMWDDLVADQAIQAQLSEIKTWMADGDELMKKWGLDKKIKPGYKAVFYGAQGTGKTLAATLLGKDSGRDVYRADLAMISTGDTEKIEAQLYQLFSVAEGKNMILYFDNADILFEKQGTGNGHGYTLAAYMQHYMESFPGVAILSAGHAVYTDSKLASLLQAFIHFTMPNANERYQLWQSALPRDIALSEDTDMRKIAEDHVLSGGSIMNAVRFCALASAKRNDSVIQRADILSGIEREMKKKN